MSTIVTHLNPDLDAITSVWLLQRFMPGFSDAEVKFVPAGLNSKKQFSKGELLSIDHGPSSTDQLWVDTGSGELDHHQENVKTCAAVLPWEHILQKTNVQVTQDPRCLKPRVRLLFPFLIVWLRVCLCRRI